MPRAPVAIAHEHFGERRVRGAPLGDGGGVIDGRADQRMAEVHVRPIDRNDPCSPYRLVPWRNEETAVT